jgi:thiol-disulfide isomerase/thioredoxin
LLAGLVLAGAGLGLHAAPNTPTVEQMLTFKPAQKGIVYSTPAPEDYAKCTVELAEGKVKGASGWVLKDPRGQLLRKYFDTNADKYPDHWSYYKDGLEVYREVDSNFNGKGFDGKVDHYLWLNSGGMKVGLDRDQDGTIDTWEAISVEELSQEVVQALATRNQRALDALLVNEDDLRTLGTPAREVARIRDGQKQVAAKFQKLAGKYAHLNESTRWIHVETQPPSRLSADVTGMKQDVLMYYRAMVLCETGQKTDTIQLPEIVQVGDAWKLLDAPLSGEAETVINVTQPAGGTRSDDPDLQAAMSKLADVDKNAPAHTHVGPNAEVVRYYLERVAVLNEIAAKAKDSDRDMWLKQIVDSLGTAAQASPAGDNRAMTALTQLADRFARERPGADVAAYAAFRQLNSDYNSQVANVKKADEMLALQTKHVDRLAKFVQTYPRAEEAAEALWELGRISEYQHTKENNKEVEARRYYEQLARGFGNSRQGLKAQGALRRLNLVGSPWDLGNVPVVSLTGHNFGMASLRGKVVVAFYYASWCQTVQADFAKLSQLVKTLGSQGVEVVAINLDDDQATAAPFAKQFPNCWHLFSAGGLEGPLPTQYGLISYPTVFLIGRDGKVITRSIDAAGVEEEIRKLK